MKQIKILKLAHSAALEIWAREFERKQAHPDNKIIKMKEERAWDDLEELERLIALLESEDEE